MPVTVGHNKAITIADGTNTNIVLPSDWNSVHNVTLSLAGNEVVKVFQAGTNSISSGTLSFADSNGITFGMATNGVVTGTVKTDYQSAGAYLTTAQPVGAYLTTARASNDAIGLNTALTANGVSVTANSSGLSLNFPSFLTTAAQSNHSHNFATTTTTGSLVVVGTTNSAGVTIGVPNYLTTTAAQSVQPVAYAAGGTTNNFSTLAFGNSNGLSWSTGTQGVFPGTAVLTTAAQSNHSHGNPTLALTNLTGTTASASNGFTLSLSAGAGGTVNQTGPNIAAGGVTVTDGTVVFSNANGVSFGIAGSTMTASAAGGGGATLSRWMGPGMGLSSITSHSASALNGSIIIGMEQIPVNVSASKIGIVLGHSIVTSYNTSQVASLTLNMAVYGRVNSTAISMMSSGTQSFSMSWSSSTTTGVVGMREVYVPFNMNLTPGVYYIARQMSLTGNNASAATAHTISHFGVPTMSAISAAGDGYGVATAASNAAMVPFQGGFSVTSGAFPATIGLSDMVHTGTIYAHANYWREFVG